MADTLIQATPDGSMDVKESLFGPQYIDEDTCAVVYGDVGADPNAMKSTDGGATYGAPSEVGSGVNTWGFSAYYGPTTVGVTEKYIHCVWIDAGGGTPDRVAYAYYDIPNASWSSIVSVDATFTDSPTNIDNKTAVTITEDGAVVVTATSDGNDSGAWRATSPGGAFSAIGDPYEASDTDFIYLFPASGTGDAGDACALFWDITANALSVKMYDKSLDTWTETAIAGTFVEDISFSRQAAGTVRHSDGHVLFVIHKDSNSSTADVLATYDINPSSIVSPSVTAKTSIYDNTGADSITGNMVAIVIDQNSDDTYVAYVKLVNPGSWLGEGNHVVFHRSTDGMATWGSEQAYTETQDDYRMIHGGNMVGSAGGKVQWTVQDDDQVDLIANLVNDVAIAAASGKPWGYYQNLMRRR